MIKTTLMKKAFDSGLVYILRRLVCHHFIIMAWIIDYTHGTGAVDTSYILIQRERKREKIWDWLELLKPQSQPQ